MPVFTPPPPPSLNDLLFHGLGVYGRLSFAVTGWSRNVPPALFPPSLPPYLLPLPGIVFSSLGAAMQCLVGASRLVAAIANDHTIPLLRPFAPKPDEEPSKALYLVWVLASLPCLAGNLDYITPVMTMFFLLM